MPEASNNSINIHDGNGTKDIINKVVLYVEIGVGNNRAKCLLYNEITKNCRPKWRKLHLQIGEKCRGIWLVPGTV